MNVPTALKKIIIVMIAYWQSEEDNIWNTYMQFHKFHGKMNLRTYSGFTILHQDKTINLKLIIEP